ncbi:glutathione S-transferase family protein [Jannaschia aquimarina]|uniref:YfcG_3 protein n=1 Tax=Jannaschia aquimarina TaxID=935700 RepID=A0A0D1EM76_9RHOB|nr:glutathione binding-like protein [Jannaschia aquimarina]KIT18086.1 Disulfide-bond oxidoreductase YfcG [Jannaschia aquimarina]SNT40648.1 GST-like protein [Jannaschia aquimarina]
MTAHATTTMTKSPATNPTPWPATDPGKLQLFTEHTPNGAKVSIALEEFGLPYEVHHVRLADKQQKHPAFVALAPNGKIPALIDPDGPDGAPIALSESGAILLYLAEKTGRLMPTDARGRFEVTQWLMFQMASVGPMFGQFGHFHHVMAGKSDDPYPAEKYAEEARRLYGVIDNRLDGRPWIAGDAFGIADIALAPWIWCLEEIYRGGDRIGADGFANLRAWYDRITARPSWKRGLYAAKPHGR